MSHQEEILLSEYRRKLVSEIAYVEKLMDEAEFPTTWDLFPYEAKRLHGALEACENILGLLGEEV